MFYILILPFVLLVLPLQYTAVFALCAYTQQRWPSALHYHLCQEKKGIEF